MLTGPLRAVRTLVTALVIGATPLIGAAPFVGAARADDPALDARTLVASMGETVISILADKRLDRATREARFRAMYRANFDHAAIGAWVLGRPWADATPAQRREYLAVLEDYIVKFYVEQLGNYRGERLLVLKSEDVDGGAVVTSLIIDPNPRASSDIEVTWRFGLVGGRPLVRDVVIDKISMVLSERRAFADWLRERGGSIEGLVGKLREKIAELDSKSG